MFADVVAFVLNQSLIVDAVPPIPCLIVRDTVRYNAQPSGILVERFDDEGTLDENVVAATVEMIQAVRPLLVADQQLSVTHTQILGLLGIESRLRADKQDQPGNIQPHERDNDDSK